MNKFSRLQAYFTNKEILKRLLVTFVLLFVFRALSKVPAPGIEANALQSIFGGSQSGFFNIANILAGGTLTQFSIISVGLIAFVNASIILQLLGTIVPKIEQIQKMGEVGQKMINQWTRLLTVPLAAIQSFGIYLLLKSNANSTGQQLIDNLSTFRVVSLVFTLTAGAMLLMWIAEIMSDAGLGGKRGGGTSIIVTAGILSALPTSITQAFSAITTSEFLKNVWISLGVEILLFLSFILILFVLVKIGKLAQKPKTVALKAVSNVFYFAFLMIIPISIYIIAKHDTAITENIRLVWKNNLARLDNVEFKFGFYVGMTIELIALITYFNESIRRVPIKFINRIRNNGQSSAISDETAYLPIKLLAPGVIPIIFATSLLLLPQILYRFLGGQIDKSMPRFGEFLRYMSESWLNQQTSIYFHLLQFMLVIGFSFFYIFVIMKPENIADDLKRSQSFIPNVRPGKETVTYISSIIAKVTFWGGIILATVSSLPFILGIYKSTVSSGMEAFIGGGTSILIVVSSILAVKIQLDAMVLSKNYEQFEEI
jgi:preprotein translocase subunit SecY